MKRASLAVWLCVLANCAGTTASDSQTGGAGGAGGAGGSGGSSTGDLCYADSPCYVSNKKYRCTDGQHYQTYEEVSCSSICGGRPCSGGGCRLGNSEQQCPQGRTCQPGEDNHYEPCWKVADAGDTSEDAAGDAATSDLNVHADGGLDIGSFDTTRESKL
jgi:hypothetical protein